MKSIASAFLAGLTLTLASGAALAQAYPSKPIRWVVPYPAGGGSDFLARTIGQQLSTQIGQSVVVENKPGGNTAIAASDVARAPADGYTMLSADNGTMTFNTALYSKLSYHPVILAGNSLYLSISFLQHCKLCRSITGHSIKRLAHNKNAHSCTVILQPTGSTEAIAAIIAATAKNNYALAIQLV